MSAGEGDGRFGTLSPEDREYLIMLYGENAEHARQHETMRATATGLFIALIAGILAFAAGENGKRIEISGALVCAVSALGCIVNHKHYERYVFHLNRVRGYRKALESNLRDDIPLIRIMRDEEHNKTYAFTHKWIKLHILWLVIYLATFSIGTIMMLWPKIA